MPKASAPDGLTDKQRLWVQEYPKDNNATQAAIRAGYSERTAHRIGAENLQKPALQAALDKYRAEAADMSAVELKEIIDGLREGIELSRNDGNLATYMKGYELLGKTIGAYTDRIEGEMDIGLVTVGKLPSGD